jgi:hypothetical protein
MLSAIAFSGSLKYGYNFSPEVYKIKIIHNTL